MRYAKIIDVARCAPSGDNCQPWRFGVEEGHIRLYNLPEKDTSLFNYKQRASLVAHGALLENLLIAASTFGYRTKFSYFPDGANSNCVAIVELEVAPPTEEPLYPYITSRSTNRHPYRKQPLTAIESASLINAAKSIGAGNIFLGENEVKKTNLAEVVGINDQLVFENIHLHSFLFEHIRWTDEEAQLKKDGLDIKTLELSPIDACAFRLFKNYSLLSKLKRFGVTKIVANNAKKLSYSASAIGLITMPDRNPDNYLNAGRVLQRTWLEATRLGLSFQLMTGITFLMEQVHEGITENLSPDNLELINKAYSKIGSIYDINNETLAVMFRVGHSEPPSRRSLRLPTEQYVESSPR